MNLPIVLTGIRPTGPLHLGHYVGALRQWLPLQKTHQCFFLVADVQALTTHADKPALIEDSVRQVVLDFLAVGLDPDLANVHFVLQSAVPHLTELTVYLSMCTPNTWMEHNPTIRAERENLAGDPSVGFMMYPVSQAADILFVSPDPIRSRKGSSILVPVGEDQVPHLRDNNRIAARFNELYGATFVMCEPLIGEVGRLVGTDGKAKMSKSLGNAIFLGDDEKTLRKKVMSMFTDPKRTSANIPGTVEGNPVFIYLETFCKDSSVLGSLKEKYRAGKIGDVAVKQVLFDWLHDFLAPIRQRRSEAEKENFVGSYLQEGTAVAQERAEETLLRVRRAMHLNYSSLWE